MPVDQTRNAASLPSWLARNWVTTGRLSTSHRSPAEERMEFANRGPGIRIDIESSPVLIRPPLSILPRGRDFLPPFSSIEVRFPPRCRNPGFRLSLSRSHVHREVRRVHPGPHFGRNRSGSHDSGFPISGLRHIRDRMRHPEAPEMRASSTIRMRTVPGRSLRDRPVSRRQSRLRCDEGRRIEGLDRMEDRKGIGRSGRASGRWRPMGRRSGRASRIATTGEWPMTIQRHVSSGAARRRPPAPDDGPGQGRQAHRDHRVRRGRSHPVHEAGPDFVMMLMCRPGRSPITARRAWRRRAGPIPDSGAHRGVGPDDRR